MGAGGCSHFPFYLFIDCQNHFKNNNLLLTVDKSHLMSTVHRLKNLTFRGLSLCYRSDKDSVLYLFTCTVFIISISILVRQHFLILHRGKCVLSFQLITTNAGLSLPPADASPFFFNQILTFSLTL